MVHTIQIDDTNNKAKALLEYLKTLDFVKLTDNSDWNDELNEVNIHSILTPLEESLTTLYKDEMVAFLKKHPEYFEEAIQLAISDKQPYSWRSAWLLWSVMTKNDSRFDNYIPAILQSIKDKQDGHQRELLKILYLLEIDEAYEGQLFDLCISLWENIEKKPSIRYTAFRFLVKITNKHPELRRELDFLLEPRYFETLSPGVKKGVFKMLKNQH